ncbi:hypothetical protein GWK47_008747 [Chionoecetes opilio]|uniref:Uncharacterized protein n=1 Tax=Chionoecetes opilio TaxID=41210 RepID=A0A8J4Y4X8_CHIOP|nr:hypothetical protein GWK47_008747 [Chionoecetes opilio]
MCGSYYDLLVNKETSREHAEVNVQVGDDGDVKLRGQDVFAAVKSFTDLLSRGRLVCPSQFTVSLTKDVCHRYWWLWKENATRYALFGCTKPKATFQQGTKIFGLGYDGRKNKTRAMVPDSYGKLHPRLIREEHVSVTEEPSGRYLWHFVPEDPVLPEKPAFKVAQALYDLLVTYDSTDSLIVL